jgi:hypothetical protein
MSYLPPKIPPTPKQQAEIRARRIAMVLRAAMWLIAVLPFVFLLMVYGYSDQAPAFLREIAIAVDSAFGRPVWALIGPKS